MIYEGTVRVKGYIKRWCSTTRLATVELLASSGLMGFMEGALLPEARESKIN